MYFSTFLVINTDFLNSGTTAVKDGPAARQALQRLIIKCQLSMVFH
jgi:hypothetical protein